MSIIPCERDLALKQKIEAYAEVLKTQAHTLGDHGLSEEDFYQSGVFRGAIERIRGQFSATMRIKREFVRHILDYMVEKQYIESWRSAGESNRHDYAVQLSNGRTAVIELKGCLDGNNTNIFERPPNADEFVLWSLCTNLGADPRHNVWSGIHTRLSAEIIDRHQVVDGVVVWDWLCGTACRHCPKINNAGERTTKVASYILPPPCIFVFPRTIPSPRNNPHPQSQQLNDIGLLQAFHDCFQGRDDEVHYVDMEVHYEGTDLFRKTRVRRGGAVVQESNATAIRRA